MYVTETNSCCSILELGGLHGLTCREFNNTLKEYLNEYYFMNSDVEIAPNFMAVTTESQITAKKVLNRYGFVPTVIPSRHKGKQITLWFRTGLPEHLIPWYNRKIKEVETYVKDNF